MKCPKCGGIMMYQEHDDVIMCLNCFYKKVPDDRKNKTKLRFRAEDFPDKPLS